MDAEMAVRDYLAARPDVGVPVCYDVPEDASGEFATVSRTGGTAGEWGVDRPEISVRCYGESRPRCVEIAQAVTAALLEMRYDLDEAFSCSVGGVSKDRDLDSGRPFARVVCQLTLNE